jgi:aryl-alcohol dehydrogenase-like predicted oxidoreductase
VKERRPILTLRTVGGGPADARAARPEKPGDYVREPSRELLPLYRASGYGSWVDFCMAFVFSRPFVACTIGACTTPAHLDAYLAGLAQRGKPFNAELASCISALHERIAKNVQQLIE